MVMEKHHRRRLKPAAAEAFRLQLESIGGDQTNKQTQTNANKLNTTQHNSLARHSRRVGCPLRPEPGPSPAATDGRFHE
jgi:hypothetical protein